MKTIDSAPSSGRRAPAVHGYSSLSGSRSEKKLTAQLKELEADGIIQRKVIPTVPVQVEYAVTEHGKTLFPILDAMCDWGCKNSNGRYVMTHPTCKEE